MWILVVEDEPAMGDLLRQGLEEQNHNVTLARDGHEGKHAAESNAFDAIILDVMLPGMDGLEVARSLRKSAVQTPILMLTARDSTEDIIRGLDAGADDYLVKPFALSVLVARLRAISRRASRPAVAVLQTGDLRLDPGSREVTRQGAKVNLTATEFRVLEHLMRRPGRASSRSEIIEAVWGFESEVEENTVDAYIKLLRDKIDAGGAARLIHTIRGFGYILREPA